MMSFAYKDRKLQTCIMSQVENFLFVQDLEKWSIAYIGQGEYFGELSFFDHLPRSADVIAVEQCQLLKIPGGHLKSQFPTWLLIMAKQMTQKIRMLDSVISNKGIKRQNVETMKPLSIDEQRKIYDLLSRSEV